MINNLKLNELVKQNYNKLNQTDRYIWSYIKEHVTECSSISIYELAKLCNVSHTTIIRFIRKIGLDGMGELKSLLKWSNDLTAHIDENMVDYLGQDYQLLADYMKQKDFTKLFQAMDKASHIYAYGIGTIQKHAVSELKRIFLYAQKIIHNIDGEMESCSVISMLQENDVIFIYPREEDYNFIKQFTEQLLEKGVIVIYVCKVGNEFLIQGCNECISFYQRRFELMNKVYESSAPYFIIAELLFIQYMIYQNEVNKIE